jgi:hypothetical protein
LLIDLDQNRTDAASPAVEKSENAPISAPTNQPPMTESGKRVLVMKRQVSNSNSLQSRPQDAKPVLTAEEREKAYQEARARIFGSEESQPDTEKEPVDASAKVQTKPQVLSSKASSVDRGSQDLDSSVAKGNVRMTSSVGDRNAGREERPLRINVPNPTGGRGRGKLVDVGSWKENKSQIRDKDAERSDPDFVRRGSPNVSQSNIYSASENFSPAPSPQVYPQQYSYQNYDSRSPRDPYRPAFPPNYGNIPPAPTLTINNYYPYDYQQTPSMWNTAGSPYNPQVMSRAQLQYPPQAPADWQQQSYPATSPYARQPQQNYEYRPASTRPPTNNNQDFPPLS